MFTRTVVWGLMGALAMSAAAALRAQQVVNIPRVNSYEDLAEFFLAWREFQSPPLVDGSPERLSGPYGNGGPRDHHARREAGDGIARAEG
jgi:hypothetical protein